jgi:hypothetical protein
MRYVRGSLKYACWASAAAIALAAPASAETPVEIVEGWIAQAGGFDWLEVSHAGVSHDAASGTTTIERLEIAIDLSDLPGGTTEGESDRVDLSYSFTFPTLVFEGLDVDGAYYVADSIQADALLIDMQIDSEQQGTSSTTGSYDGLSATRLRWARLPEIEDDPARPVSRFYPLAAALVDVSFEAMEFGTLELVSETSEPQMTTTIRYGAGTVGATESGNISTMSVDGIWVSGAAEDDDAAAMAFEMEIGTVEAGQYNYGDMVRLFDPEAAPGSGDESYETMSGWFSAADWTISAQDVEVTIEEMRMEDLGGRRPTVPVLARADEIFVAATEEGAEPDPTEVAELVSAFYGAFSLGLAETSGIEVSFDEYRGSIDAVGVAGLSAGGIESIHYRGFEASDSAGDVEVRLGDFTISDFRFPSLAALIGFEAAQEEAISTRCWRRFRRWAASRSATCSSTCPSWPN